VNTRGYFEKCASGRGLSKDNMSGTGKNFFGTRGEDCVGATLGWDKYSAGGVNTIWGKKTEGNDTGRGGEHKEVFSAHSRGTGGAAPCGESGTRGVTSHQQGFPVSLGETPLCCGQQGYSQRHRGSFGTNNLFCQSCGCRTFWGRDTN